MTTPDWLAVDWGTTQLRVWAMDHDDEILDCRTSTDGMGSLGGDPAAFNRAFATLTTDWRDRRKVKPAVVCGMAGAREGWHAAPYAPVDTPLDALVGAAVKVAAAETDLDVRLLPGLAQHAPPDVMRGEETKLLGLGEVQGLVIMPGTHPKWARLDAGRVVRFQTAMTGDVFQAIATGTVLRHSVDGTGFDLDVFQTAVDEARQTPGALLRRCFSLRAGDLLEGQSAIHARSKLSGWLTGLEVADALATLGSDGPITLVGGEAQAERYERALTVFDRSAEPRDADTLTLAGLKAARHRLFPEI